MLYFVGLVVRMALRPACIFFLILFGFECIAQTDSLYTDTVIIVQPPLVIKKQVHVSVTEYIKEESSIELGAYVRVQWNLSQTGGTYTSLFYSSGLQARYNLMPFQMAISIGFTTATGTEEYQITEVVADTVSKSCFDYTLPDGTKKLSCQYDIDYTTEPKTKQRQQDPIMYLHSTLSPSYIYVKKKWRLAPGLRLTYNRFLGANSDLLWEGNLWMVGTDCKLGYYLHPDLLAEMQLSYDRNVSSINHSQAEQQWNLIGLGLGFFYHF